MLQHELGDHTIEYRSAIRAQVHSDSFRDIMKKTEYFNHKSQYEIDSCCVVLAHEYT